MTNVHSLANLKQAKEIIQNMIKVEARCLQCGKLLAKCNNESKLLAGEIKCPRCRAINVF